MSQPEGGREAVGSGRVDGRQYAVGGKLVDLRGTCEEVSRVRLAEFESLHRPPQTLASPTDKARPSRPVLNHLAKSARPNRELAETAGRYESQIPYRLPKW